MVAVAVGVYCLSAEHVFGSNRLEGGFTIVVVTNMLPCVSSRTLSLEQCFWDISGAS